MIGVPESFVDAMSTKGKHWDPSANKFHFIIIIIFLVGMFLLLYFTLQYCIGFAMHWHESAMGVYELPILDFIFLSSKVTVDGDCNHEMKRLSFLGRKVMTNLDSILDLCQQRSI